jgi:hypothetical protein
MANNLAELEEMVWLWIDLLPPGEVEEWEMHEYLRMVAANMGWEE